MCPTSSGGRDQEPKVQFPPFLSIRTLPNSGSGRDFLLSWRDATFSLSLCFAPAWDSPMPPHRWACTLPPSMASDFSLSFLVTREGTPALVSSQPRLSPPNLAAARQVHLLTLAGARKLLSTPFPWRELSAHPSGLSPLPPSGEEWAGWPGRKRLRQDLRWGGKASRGKRPPLPQAAPHKNPFACLLPLVCLVNS